MAEKTTKELAQRIDPVYFRSWHRLRKARFLLSVGVCLAAVVWIGLAAVLGDETIFANGPVARSHALFEADCAKCHTESFGSVPDAACTACHAASAHAEEDPACAHCHTEHAGRTDLRRRVADAHCNECHVSHAGIASLERHIDFQVKERDQHLRFSHAAHLAPDLQKGPLECGSCHELDRTGRVFSQISFAEHCRRCHEERLDARIDETVPHGLQPDELRDWIAAAYVRRLGAVDPARDLPGRGAQQPDWRAELLRKTEASLGALLRPGGGCMLCHVSREGRIAPPAVPRSWLVKARFQHHAHRTESCSRCHDVSASRDAQTLALPTIVTCRQCHKPGGAGESCDTCHGFHRRGAGR